jgi:hypothetical protein
MFVATLFATGVFLITYKAFERTLENTLSIVAGILAMLVALFPTSRPPGSTSPPTALEAHLGEGFVATVHYSCAAVFVALLAAICVLFGIRRIVERILPARGETAAVLAFGASWFMKGFELDILLAPRRQT